MERKVSTIIPSIAPQTCDPALDHLFDPSRHFSRPRDVLNDDRFDIQEKRAILSSWASDACAVESMSALRQPLGAEQPVAFDEIMDALRELESDCGDIGQTTASDRKCRSGQNLDADDV
jgi:hypothetical protein